MTQVNVDGTIVSGSVPRTAIIIRLLNTVDCKRIALAMLFVAIQENLIVIKSDLIALLKFRITPFCEFCVRSGFE